MAVEASRALMLKDETWDLIAEQMEPTDQLHLSATCSILRGSVIRTWTTRRIEEITALVTLLQTKFSEKFTVNDEILDALKELKGKHNGKAAVTAAATKVEAAVRKVISANDITVDELKTMFDSTPPHLHQPLARYKLQNEFDYAVLLGNKAAIRDLIARGAIVTTDHLNTAVHTTIQTLHPEYVPGCIVDDDDYDHILYYTYDMEVVRAMINAGAKPTTTTLLSACNHQSPARLFNLLLEHGATPTTEVLESAIQMCNYEKISAIVQALVAHGAKPSSATLYEVEKNSSLVSSRDVLLMYLIQQGAMPTLDLLNRITKRACSNALFKEFIRAGVVPDLTTLNNVVGINPLLDLVLAKGVMPTEETWECAMKNQDCFIGSLQTLYKTGVKPTISTLENAVRIGASNQKLRFLLSTGLRPTPDILSLAERQRDKRVFTFLSEAANE